MINKNKKGFILISTLIILVVLFLVTIGFSTITVNNVRSSKDLEDATLTLYLADAGVEYAIFLLNHDWAIERNADNNGHNGKDLLNTEFVLASNLIGSSYTGTTYFGTFEVVSLEPFDASGRSTNNPARVETIRVASIGRMRKWTRGGNITKSIPSQDIKGSPVAAQRTVYARLSLRRSGSSTSGSIGRYFWYEKYR